jgi:hypothetical protein
LLFLQWPQRESQPKSPTGENSANREGNDWEILFGFLSSVYSVFSMLKIFAFFAHILLVSDYARISDKLKPEAPSGQH